MIKLHVGCGTNYFDGWINIDNNSDNNIEKLDVPHDVRKPLPFRDSMADFVFCEHLLEHLAPTEGVSLLREFLRVLKPGGVCRIAMPDLENIVADYYNPKWAEAEWLKKFGMEWIETRAELINVNFRLWGHKWLYDWEELERRLKEAGAETIVRCRLRQSEHQELCNLETRDESVLIAEVTR